MLVPRRPEEYMDICNMLLKGHSDSYPDLASAGWEALGRRSLVGLLLTDDALGHCPSMVGWKSNSSVEQFVITALVPLFLGSTIHQPGHCTTVTQGWDEHITLLFFKKMGQYSHHKVIQVMLWSVSPSWAFNQARHWAGPQSYAGESPDGPGLPASAQFG